MSQDLESRVLELEISNVVGSLKWSALWVFVSVWFIILNVTGSQWVMVAIWALLGGLHVHSGVHKWQKLKDLKEKRRQ